MAQFDLITRSFKSAWNADYSTTVPTNNFYYGRAQQPAELAGFPYGEIYITEDEPEPTTRRADGRLITYHLTIKVWTCQGMIGVTSSGDQMTDQGIIMRALEAVLSSIPPNQAWEFVTGFKHCLEGASSLAVDEEMYLGKDVLISESNWTMLVGEL